MAHGSASDPWRDRCLRFAAEAESCAGYVEGPAFQDYYLNIAKAWRELAGEIGPHPHVERKRIILARFTKGG